MTTWLKAATTALILSLITVNQAFADLCLPLVGCIGGGDGGTATPEFDGPGAVAAASLLVSVGLLLYNRARS